jgi:hypothetical protein
VPSLLSLAGVLALGLLACSSDPTDKEDPTDETAQVGERSAEWRRSRRTWTAPASADETVVTRQTADGELIEVIVPEPAPTIEVPAGGQCGVANADGVLLSCEPGTYCLSPAEGVPGTCEVAPRAPISEG